MLSRGRSFDRASESADFRTFPAHIQVPEPRQLWWWRTRGLWHELGFSRFLKSKIFRWRLCNLKKQSMFGAFWFKIWFSKMICWIWLFGVYQSHIALFEIRFRTVTGVRTVGPIRALRKGGAKKVESTKTILECRKSLPQVWRRNELKSQNQRCLNSISTAHNVALA